MKIKVLYLISFFLSFFLSNTKIDFLEANSFEFKEFTEKKDITSFIHSQFANPPTYTIEYFTGEV